MIDLERKVRERAYQIWEQEGRVHGRDEQHWHRAKLELTSSLQEPAAVIEAGGIAAEPVKKSRRTAKPKAADPVPVPPPAAPRRRRAPAPLQ
jgi:Protein of unknown function (DUF2934)